MPIRKHFQEQRKTSADNSITMGAIAYRVRALNAKQTKAVLSAKCFPHVFKKGKRRGNIKSAQGPLFRQRYQFSAKTFFQLKRVTTQTSQGGKKFGSPALYVQWMTCRLSNCADVKQQMKRQLKKQGLKPSLLQRLPKGLKIVEVRHGDINFDGYTDVMVRFRHGASVVYQQLRRR